MLCLYSPDLIATANKIQHYSAVHHLLFQKAMELWFFFLLSQEELLQVKQSRSCWALHSIFMLPLFQPRHRGPSSAGVSWLHLLLNALSTCIASWWWGAGATEHHLLLDNSSQVRQHLMGAAPGLQRHPWAQEPAGTRAGIQQHIQERDAPLLVGHPCPLCPALGLAASKMLPTWNLNNLSYSSTKLK